MSFSTKMYFVVRNIQKAFTEEHHYMVFSRNATHCISPYAIVVCVCVCLCMPRVWTPGKRFEIDYVFFFDSTHTGIAYAHITAPHACDYYVRHVGHAAGSGN